LDANHCASHSDMLSSVIVKVLSSLVLERQS